MDHLARIDSQNQEILSVNKELLWSQIYHDSIRGYSSLQDLSLNIGRWAGNYAFFYYLFRVLKDARPKSILELGLGESTKFISTFIENEITDCRHLVVEHDQTWLKNFNKSFILGNKTKVESLKLDKLEFKESMVTTYHKRLASIPDLYEFYLVDGPFGSPEYSRIDILSLADRFPKAHEFVILFDDTNRKGEQNTFQLLVEKLKGNGFDIGQTHAQGTKRVSLIATPAFKWLTSI